MRAIKKIIIHAAATPPSMDVGVEEITQWHKARGFSTVGYHAVIRRDGQVESGRPIEITGAHAKGFNAFSIGVCLVGGINKWNEPEFNFTRHQLASLDALIESYKQEYHDAEVMGHRDLPGVTKACPCFNARAWHEDYV